MREFVWRWTFWGDVRSRETAWSRSHVAVAVAVAVSGRGTRVAVAVSRSLRRSRR